MLLFYHLIMVYLRGAGQHAGKCYCFFYIKGYIQGGAGQQTGECYWFLPFCTILKEVLVSKRVNVTVFFALGAIFKEVQVNKG